jgi:hypothetical protein
MPTSDEYRAFAAAERRKAELSDAPATRDRLLTSALKWDGIAEEMDRAVVLPHFFKGAIRTRLI